MGYLVQNNFKNFYKDVRLKDLIYVDNLEDIVVEAVDYKEQVGPYLYFEDPEMAQAYADALNVDVGKGFAKARPHGTISYPNVGEVYTYAVDCYLPLVKYWKLENGQPLPKPVTKYMTPNYFLVDKKELQAIIQPIAEAFAKYEPDYNAE